MPSIVGLDIGTSSFKVAELASHGDKWNLLRLTIYQNPLGRLLVDSPEDKKELVVAIKKLVTDSDITRSQIHLGLPESQVFTRVIKMPVLSKAELASAIQWEAEQHIPIPMDQVKIDYFVMRQPESGIKEGGMDVLLVGVKKSVINYFIDILTAADLEIKTIETGILGLVRAITTPEDPPTLIMHLGASSSDFCVTAAGQISLTYSVPTAGLALTRAVSSGLQLPLPQAEAYKRTYGLKKDVLEGKVRAVLLPVFQTIASEAKKVINAHESAKSGQKIQRLIISGGTSLMTELTPELATTLGVNEIVIADPFTNLNIDPKLTLPNEKPVYSVAIGLAKGKD